MSDLILLVVTLAIFVLMALISIITVLKAPDEAQLPMQWGLDGQVNWSLPTKWAVLVWPVLTLFSLAMVAGVVLALDIAYIPMSVHLMALAIIGVTFIMGHAGHMYFAVKSVNKT